MTGVSSSSAVDRMYGPDQRRRLNIGRAAAVCLASFAAALLAGCSNSSREAAALACPSVLILADASEVTQFRPSVDKLSSDIISRGTMTKTSGECRYNRAGAVITTDLSIIADRGPALQGDSTVFEYFAAVMAPDQRILAREVFSTAVDFRGQPRAGVQEQLEQRIPLPPGVNAGGYQIVYGFQLTPDQLQFNEQRRGFVLR
jgi:hypothetical protein